MDTVNQTANRPARGLSPLYVAVWATLAAVALAYLALMVARPEFADGLLQRLPSGSPEDNRGQRAMARLATEVRDLKQTVKQLEAEISDLRLTATAAERANAALVARLTTVENGLKSVIGPHSRVASAPKASGTPAVAGFLEERPPSATRQVDPSRAAVLGLPSPPRGTSEGSAAGVQLAVAPSLDALRLSWQLMQESHRSIIRGLEPRFIEAPGDPPSFRLIAGPVATDEDAGKLCERMRTRRVNCTIAPFSGKPL